MKIKVQNNQLGRIILFLKDLNLKGKASLGRTKLKKKLEKKSEVYGEDQVDIINIYATWTNREAGQYKWNPDQVEEGKEVMKALDDREVEVDLFEYSGYIEPLKKAVLDFDEEVAGDRADGWDDLVDAFENAKDNKEEKKNGA